MAFEIKDNFDSIFFDGGDESSQNMSKNSVLKIQDDVVTIADGNRVLRLTVADVISPSFSSLQELYQYLEGLINNTSSFPGGEGVVDAGNRLRVSQITTLLDIKQVNDNAPLFYSRVQSNATQVYDIAKGGTDLELSGVTDGYAIAQTKMFAPYYSGKSQFGEITFSGLNHETNTIKRAGYYSSSTTAPYDISLDGLWFESDGTDYRLKIYNHGTEILNVAQSSWNLDQFNNHDFSKFNVFVFQFLYLGGTSVRLGFIQNGAIKWAHVYAHAGFAENTFVRSPAQPIRYEVRTAAGLSATGSFTQICATVVSEGSLDEVGLEKGFDLDHDTISANTPGVFYAAIGLRLKPAYRNVRINEEFVSVLATTNDPFVWRLLSNPTVAGTFTYNDEPDSALQVAYGDTTGNPSTNTVTGGRIVATGNGAGNSGVTELLKSAVRIGSTIEGDSDELVLVITPITNNLSATTSLSVTEQP